MHTHARWFRLGFLFFWLLTTGLGFFAQHEAALAATPPPGDALLATEGTPIITPTVVKQTPQEIVCTIVNWANTYAPHASLTLSLDVGSGTSTPVDWQDATYTIFFIGKQTFTDANLKANSSEQVIVSTPPVPDKYQIRCRFNGTALFNPVETAPDSLWAIVSANHPIGGIQLSTNPTTLRAGQTATYHVVIVGTARLPAPTGQIALFIGTSYTSRITLGSGGTVTFQATAPSPLGGTSIKVAYYGDPVYTWSSATFPLTNPPISSAGGSSPTPTPPGAAKPTSTPPVSATPTSMATASGTTDASATPTGTVAASSTSSGNHGTGASSSQGNMALWIVLAALFVLAGGGAMSIVLPRKRSARARITTHDTLPTMSVTHEDV